MKKKLHLLLTLALLTMGVNSSWGKTVTIYPTKERVDRTKSPTPSGTAWQDGYPKLSSASGNTSCEVKNIDARIWTLEQFEIPDIDHVKSIDITYTRVSGQTNTGVFGIWGFDYTYPADNADASTTSDSSTTSDFYLDHVKGVLGVYPGNEINLTDYAPLAIPTGTDTRTASLNVSNLKDKGTTAAGKLTVNLLLTTTTTSTMNYKFYSINNSNTDANKPHMTVVYYPVYNTTKQKGYDDLASALEEISTDDNLLIRESLTISSTLTISDATITLANGVTLTINNSPTLNDVTFNVVSGGTATIKRGTVTGELFTVPDTKSATFNGAAGTLYLEDTSTATGSMLTAEEGATISLTNVTVKNSQVSNNAPLQCIGNMSLTDVTFDNISSTLGAVWSRNNVTLSGTITFNNTCTSDVLLSVANDSKFTLSSFTSYGDGGITKIPVFITGEDNSENLQNITRGDNQTLIQGGSASDYEITNIADCTSNYGWELEDDGAGNVKAVKHFAKIGETFYASFDAAFTAAIDGNTIVLYRDVEITERKNINGSTTTKAITVSPLEGRIITIKRGSSHHGGLFLASNNTTGNQWTFDASGTGSLIIDNGNDADATSQAIDVSDKGKIVLKNVTLKNNNASQPLARAAGSGTLELDACTFTDCAAQTNKGVIFCGSTNVVLKNINTFSNCGTNFYLETGNGRLNGTDATHTTPLTFILDDTRDADSKKDVVVGAGSDLRKYRVVNKGYELYKNNSNIAFKRWLKQTYTLSVTDAGMSTLVLPFAVSTLPTGVTAYNLTTEGYEVMANSTTSIAKDKPVLIVAAKGNYTFTKSAEDDADFSADNLQNGALIGTYHSIDAADGNYVLQKHAGEDAGFYKLVASSNHVINPFRAYLSGDANNPAARLAIVFEDEETTGVNEVRSKMSEGRSEYFDLSGRRVVQPTKGLYIVNGKKVVVK